MNRKKKFPDIYNIFMYINIITCNNTGSKEVSFPSTLWYAIEQSSSNTVGFVICCGIPLKTKYYYIYIKYNKSQIIRSEVDIVKQSGPRILPWRIRAMGI